MSDKNEGLDVFKTLNDFKVFKEDIVKRVDALEQITAYGAPPKSPQYPPGLYPLPKLKSLIAKLAAEFGVPVEGTLKDFIDALGKGGETTESKKLIEDIGGVLPGTPMANVNVQAKMLASKLGRKES